MCPGRGEWVCPGFMYKPFLSSNVCLYRGLSFQGFSSIIRSTSNPLHYLSPPLQMPESTWISIFPGQWHHHLSLPLPTRRAGGVRGRVELSLKRPRRWWGAGIGTSPVMEVWNQFLVMALFGPCVVTILHCLGLRYLLLASLMQPWVNRGSHLRAHLALLSLPHTRLAAPQG